MDRVRITGIVLLQFSHFRVALERHVVASPVDGRRGGRELLVLGLTSVGKKTSSRRLQ